MYNHDTFRTRVEHERDLYDRDVVFGPRKPVDWWGLINKELDVYTEALKRELERPLYGVPGRVQRVPRRRPWYRRHMSTFTKSRFWIDTAERAVKSTAQAAVLALGTEQVIDAISLDYPHIIGMALGGGLLSVLTSVASANVGSSDTASVV